MKKFFAFTIAFILLTTILCGCSDESAGITFPIDVESVENSAYTDNFEMERIGASANGSFTYWRDVATDVIYIRFRDSSGYAGMGGLTVMLDPETGLPLTYSRYMGLYNQPSASSEQGE